MHIKYFICFKNLFIHFLSTFWTIVSLFIFMSNYFCSSLRMFREETSLVNRFSLQVLYVLLKGLRLGGSEGTLEVNFIITVFIFIFNLISFYFILFYFILACFISIPSNFYFIYATIFNWIVWHINFQYFFQFFYYWWFTLINLIKNIHRKNFNKILITFSF